MPKESGLGWTLLDIDDSAGPTARQLVNDITNVDIATPRNVQDSTGMDKSAIERILLLADFSGTYNGIFNDGSNLSHDVFKTIPSTSVTRTITHTVSGQTLAVEALLTDYPLARAASGELTFAVPAVLQDGTAPSWS